METLIVGVLSVGVGLLAKVRDRDSWAADGADLGLEFSDRIIGRKKMHGRRRGFEVVIQDTMEGNRHRRVKVEVLGVDPGFSLHRKGALRRLGPRGGERRFEIGDDDFDERIRVEGDGVRARALLGPELRRRVQRLVDRGKGEVAEGAVRCYGNGIQEVKAQLEPMLDLAERLRRPGQAELPALLAERCLDDDGPEVRRGAIRQLATSFPTREETRTTA
ncbi:MAG: hypothetical protein AAFX50_23395, partial [Acidobacteriota bacterium]